MGYLLQGQMGSAGPVGESGPPGSPGISGNRGPPGITGAKGEQVGFMTDVVWCKTKRF